MARDCAEVMSELGVLKRLSDGLLSARERRNWQGAAGGFCLLIHHPAAPQPEYGVLGEEPSLLTLNLTTEMPNANLRWRNLAVAKVNSRQLPLQDDSVACVLLSHAVGRDASPELEEACRVLKPGGHLFILGLNRNGWRYLRRKTSRPLPGVNPLSIRYRLAKLDMIVDEVGAAGFLKRDWPRQMDRGWTRMLAPIADVVLVSSRHSEPAIINPIRDRKIRRVGVQSAAAGG